MKKIAHLAAASALALGMASPAHAVLLDFNLTGLYTASWQLDSNPTPSFQTSVQWQMFDHPGIYGGVAGTRDLAFLGSFFGGGLVISDPESVNGFGPQLWSGSTANPTIATGIHTLFYDGTPYYTLTITNASAPAPGVPEPATWALMLLGFGLIGAGMRRRKWVPRMQYTF